MRATLAQPPPVPFPTPWSVSALPTLCFWLPLLTRTLVLQCSQPQPERFSRSTLTPTEPSARQTLPRRRNRNNTKKGNKQMCPQASMGTTSRTRKPTDKPIRMRCRPPRRHTCLRRTHNGERNTKRRKCHMPNRKIWNSINHSLRLALFSVLDARRFAPPMAVIRQMPTTTRTTHAHP